MFCTEVSAQDVLYRSVGTGPQTNSCRRFAWYEDCMNPSTAVDMMLTVMTYGDTAAGNILAQAMGIIGNDPRVSETTRLFILGHFYVDDGMTSSQSKEGGYPTQP